MQYTITEETQEVAEEFSMSKFGSKQSRDYALLNEIARLRKELHSIGGALAKKIAEDVQSLG